MEATGTANATSATFREKLGKYQVAKKEVQRLCPHTYVNIGMEWEEGFPFEASYREEISQCAVCDHIKYRKSGEK